MLTLTDGVLTGADSVPTSADGVLTGADGVLTGADSSSTKDRIMKAAYDLISKKGYTKATTRQI
ncbi:hypothetical protein MCHI_001569 [Candidatus Magnetoovum chiemensis]|nr:hypothetical protein MCHI_001569 [Candidatus Magnetoovum chiemensis]